MRKKNTRVKVTESGLKIKKKLLKILNQLPKTKKEIIIDAVLIDDKFLVIPLSGINNIEVNPYGIFNNHLIMEEPVSADVLDVHERYKKKEVNFYGNVKPNSFFMYRGERYFKKYLTEKSCTSFRLSDGKTFRQVIKEEEEMKAKENDPLLHKRKNISKLIKNVVVTPLKLTNKKVRGGI